MEIQQPTIADLTNANHTHASAAQGGYVSGVVPINPQSGTSYTLVLGDGGQCVKMTNAGANSVTVPPNSSVAFPINTRIDILQYGAGKTTIVAGEGVTIRSQGTLLSLAAQYVAATLYKVNTDEWILIGQLTTT